MPKIQAGDREKRTWDGNKSGKPGRARQISRDPSAGSQRVGVWVLLNSGRMDSIMKTGDWPRLVTYLQYSKDIRKVIFTTTIIKRFHRQLRSVTKTKGAIPSEDALIKLLFLAQESIVAKWN